MSRLIPITERDTLRVKLALAAGRLVIDIRALERTSLTTEHLSVTGRGCAVPIERVGDLIEALQAVAAEVEGQGEAPPAETGYEA